MSFNRYVNVCASAARRVVKDPVMPKYTNREYMWYKRQQWVDGKPTTAKKEHITSQEVVEG